MPGELSVWVDNSKDGCWSWLHKTVNVFNAPETLKNCYNGKLHIMNILSE